MNDDYLWDKSGEPDPEIKKLEEILGTLRYQPQPLELPGDLRVGHKRNYYPLVAIAATIILALLATAIWLRVRTENVPQLQQANAPVIPPPPRKEEPDRNVTPEKTPAPEKHLAVNHPPRKPYVSALKKREREEALVAKEQVMLALRLASEKLNMAHRRTQSTPPANQIKNQHRIG